MTLALFAAAAAWTVIDALLYLALIVPGYVREANPLVSRMEAGWAIVARILVLLICACLALIEERLERRLLTVVVRLMLAIAAVVGVVGAAFTLASIP